MLSPYEQAKKPDKTPETDPKTADTPPAAVESNDQDVERLGLGRSLGLDDLKQIEKYSHQLDRLIEWARMKGAQSREDIVWQVRQLRNVVGGPGIGNNYAQHLAQYAYLEMERMKIDAQMKEMEHA